MPGRMPGERDSPFELPMRPRETLGIMSCGGTTRSGSWPSSRSRIASVARHARRLRRLLGHGLIVSLAATVTGACAQPAPVATPPTTSGPARGSTPAQRDAGFEGLLRQIGRAEDDTADVLTRAYVDRGARALLAAANAILDQGRDSARDRGARSVLMSLRGPDDFSFLEGLTLPSSSRPMKLSCDVDDLLFFLAQSAQFLDVSPEPSPGANDDEDRLPFIPAFARLLLRVLDQSWPTCVQTAPHAETSYGHPQATALMLMNRMVQWGGEDDGSLARDWETHGPAELRRFRKWWERNGGRYLGPSASSSTTK